MGAIFYAAFGGRVNAFLLCATSGAIFYAAFGGENRTTGLRPRENHTTALTGVGNAFPLWWLAPPPFRPVGKRVTGFSVAYGSLRIQFPCHRSSVGRQKESALMGRLGALLRPCGGPMQDLHRGTITRAYCRAIYEESVSRCFILPPA